MLGHRADGSEHGAPPPGAGLGGVGATRYLWRCIGPGAGARHAHVVRFDGGQGG